MHPENGGPPVLRFIAGARSIDLEKWPTDWPDQPDDDLIKMLRRGAPRRDSGPYAQDASTPRRRWDDQPQATA